MIESVGIQRMSRKKWEIWTTHWGEDSPVKLLIQVKVTVVISATAWY